VIEIETRAAGVTLKELEPDTLAAVPAISVCPVDTLVASPLGEIDATDVIEELQFTEVVKSSVLPSA